MSGDGLLVRRHNAHAARERSLNQPPPRFAGRERIDNHIGLLHQENIGIGIGPQRRQAFIARLCGIAHQSGAKRVRLLRLRKTQCSAFADDAKACNGHTQPARRDLIPAIAGAEFILNF